MAEGKNEETAEAAALAKAAGTKKPPAPRREIPGNLLYITSPGTLRNIIKKVIERARPDKFNYDFLDNVVKISGGNAKSVHSHHEKDGFLEW